MMGAWLPGHLNNWLAPEPKGKWRSAQLPGGSFGSWGGSFYGIPKKAQNKAAAWDFIKFLSTNKDECVQQIRWSDDHGSRWCGTVVAATVWQEILAAMLHEDHEGGW